MWTSLHTAKQEACETGWKFCAPRSLRGLRKSAFPCSNTGSIFRAGLLRTNVGTCPCTMIYSAVGTRQLSHCASYEKSRVFYFLQSFYPFIVCLFVCLWFWKLESEPGLLGRPRLCSVGDGLFLRKSFSALSPSTGREAAWGDFELTAGGSDVLSFLLPGVFSKQVPVPLGAAQAPARVRSHRAIRVCTYRNATPLHGSSSRSFNPSHGSCI